MSKITPISTKIYKPEILTCPKCGGGLKYVYTVSNKVIQFTSGKHIRVKNLGYSCPCCNDKNVYTSLTAGKLSFKGYTYSAKVICMIDYYKRKHVGREGICDLLANKDIEISDRNIDIIHKKFLSFYNLDSEAIYEQYKEMQNKYGEIRLSLDFITIANSRYVIMYNGFNGDLIALFIFPEYSEEKVKEELGKYINPTIKISKIITVRPFSKFMPIVKSLVDKTTEIISYIKF